MIKLHYFVDDENGEVQLSHPGLDGTLKFRYTSLRLAEVQLNDLREDKPVSDLEQMVEDIAEVRNLFGEIKEGFNALKKGR